MYDRRFFASKLGQAAMASVAAMVFMIALSSQMHADPVFASPASFSPDHQLVELA